MNLLKTLALTICLSSPLANAGDKPGISVIEASAFIVAFTGGMVTFSTGMEMIWNSSKTLYKAVDPNRQLPIHNQGDLHVNRKDCLEGVARGLILMSLSTATVATSILFASQSILRHPETCDCLDINL